MVNVNTFFEQQIELENERVKLVPFSRKYEEGLRKYIFNEGMEFSVQCKTEEDFQSYIMKTESLRGQKKAYPFIVIDKNTNEVAGSTRYGNLIFENKRLEIGWTWYGRAFWGSGLNKACKYELLRYAFEEMKFRRVQLSADIDNIRSQKAILKLGAQQEGIFRSNYINAKGESRDDVYYSLIYTEWEQVKSTIFCEFSSHSF